MVMDVAKSNNCIKSVRGIFEKLESDAYLDYIKEYYDTGLSRYGDTWQYADITTVLYAACQLIHPHFVFGNWCPNRKKHGYSCCYQSKL